MFGLIRRSMTATFGKILMDGAPARKTGVGVSYCRAGTPFQFLPPGCPDLNAIQVWRQMKHAILDVPYVRFRTSG